MTFDPKRIDRLAAKAMLLEEQVAALVAELEELAELARAGSAAPEPAPAAAPDPAPEPAPEPEPEPEPVAKATSAAPEAARLVALNMALSGTPREETARYLREKYDLDEDDPLLDDVYARVGG